MAKFSIQTNNFFKANIYVFTFFGLLPVNVRGTIVQPSKFFQIYNCLILFGFFAQTFFAFHHFPKLVESDLAYKATIIAGVVLGHIACITIIVIATLSVNKICKLGENIAKTDKELNKIDVRLNNKKCVIISWVESAGQTSTHVLIILLEFLFPWWIQQSAGLFIGFEIFNFYFSFFFTALIFSTNLIKLRFKCINDCLQSCSHQKLKFIDRINSISDQDNEHDNGLNLFIKKKRKVSPSEFDKGENEEYLTRKLSILQKCHFSLCEISNNFASLFTIPILFIILFTFIEMIINLYTAFTMILFAKKLDPHIMISCVKWVVGSHVRILCMVLPFTLLKNEGNKTPVLVHGLYFQIFNRKIHKQLQMFSLQLVHHKMKFTTWGMINIDMTLLASIAGAVTTYLVVILQSASSSS